MIVFALQLGHVPLLHTKQRLTNPETNISLEIGSLQISHRLLVVTSSVQIQEMPSRIQSRIDYGAIKQPVYMDC